MFHRSMLVDLPAAIVAIAYAFSGHHYYSQYCPSTVAQRLFADDDLATTAHGYALEPLDYCHDLSFYAGSVVVDLPNDDLQIG